jgi:Cu(I)/Ag(I) efflux system membrane fusion protein
VEVDKRPAAKNIILAGVVEVDETKLARVATRTKGRIDKLHAKFTGQQVKKGAPLADLCSPDIAALAQSLIDAQRSDNRDLERIARERLQLRGMDKDRVEEVLKAGKPAGQVTLRSPVSGYVLRKHQAEGSYVEEGAALVDVADLSTVWIEAEIKDEAEVAFLKERLPVGVTTKALPKREFSGQVLGLFQDEKARTLKVCFAIKNPRDELRPGMRALVRLGVPAAPQAGPSDKKEGKLKELLKERLATLRQLAQVATAEYQAGRVSYDRLHQALRAVLHAELDMCESDKERIKVLEQVVALAKDYEKSAVQRYKTGAATQSDALMAKAGRLEAEIALGRAKSKLPAHPK